MQTYVYGAQTLEHRDLNVMILDFSGRPRPSETFLPRSEEMDQAAGASTGSVVATGGVLTERCGSGGPGVCLGDGQTEAEGVPSQEERGDALLRRTYVPYMMGRSKRHIRDAKLHQTVQRRPLAILMSDRNASERL